MADIDYGKIKIVIVEGAAVDLLVELRPARGFRWRIIECFATHDDGVNRSFNWAYYDGTNEIIKEGSGAIAASVPWHLVQKAATLNSTSYPIIIDYDTYAQIRIDALTALKKQTIKALVLESA